MPTSTHKAAHGLRVVFRADASSTIGSGHIMRSAALASLLTAHGAHVAFICRELPGHMSDYLEQSGFQVHRLPAPEGEPPAAESPPHASWLGVDTTRDAEESLAVLTRAKDEVDWLIVDHYALDATWEEQMRGSVRHLMVIDDLSDRPHHCEVLLDQGLHAEPERRYAGLVPPDCRLLLGPRYALLREAFRTTPPPARTYDVGDSRVLVFFGATDRENMTGRVLDALMRLRLTPQSVEVVLGANHPHEQAIQRQAKALPGVRVHTFVEDMPGLMADADLYVGAGGSVTWERCYMGLPGVITAIAANQEPGARAMAAAGGLIYLGTPEEATLDRVTAAVQAVLDLPLWRKAMADAGQRLVDGQGAVRVGRELLMVNVSMREANRNDAERIFEWRNAEATRRYFFDPSPLQWESHLAWLEDTLARPERLLLIGEHEGIPLGVVRYDLAGEQATISIFLDPGRQEKGLGRHLIRAGQAWLRRRHPEVHVVTAEVLEENHASHQAFQAAGFQPHHRVYQARLDLPEPSRSSS